MILSGKYLRLIDQDGEVIYAADEDFVFVLHDQIKKLQSVAEHTYETDELDPFVSAIGWWLSAKP